MATEILRPNAAGDETEIDSQFPSEGEHYDKLDEEAADGDSTYVSIKSIGYQRDLYNLPAHSGSGTINHITVYAVCGAAAAPTQASLKIAIKSDGAVTDDVEQLVTESYATYSKQWATNPADSEAWEWADIDALQAGIAIRRCRVQKETKCTQVYVEVDYTEVSAYYHGLRVQGEGELALCDVGTHPLRTRKSGVTYGIELVATDDPNASTLRVKTGTGIKAIRKYT